MREKVIIAPQKGPQEKFLSTAADICIYGGAAGGGKTYGILLEPLRYMQNGSFTAVIFRKNGTQITNPGGLWDTARKIYGYVRGAYPRMTPKLQWRFRSGATITFAHIGYDLDLESWQGSQIAMIGFDELTHFTKYQFFYMLSRNRSDSGVKPYIRATCNPDADSWVAEFISWWIDQKTGYPIPERSGKLRYMARDGGDNITWADSRKELIEKGFDPILIKSVTFIASTLQDNKILMQMNPEYKANLMALPEVDRERLLFGNWKIKAAAGRFFKRTQIPPEGMLSRVPDDLLYCVRAWDLAATDEDENGNADFTAGVLMGKRKNGRIAVLNVINERIKAGDVAKLILNTAIADRSRFGYLYEVRIPQDPGAAGKIVANSYIAMLQGFAVKAEPVTGSKIVRATPFATQWQNGFIEILQADWNSDYFNQLESFPESRHDDMVDASSDAFNELANMNFDIDNLL